MAEKIPMIALSPTMDAGTIVKWRKREGEAVSSGDVLCEVETDKAVMDYESGADGVLLKILLAEGGQARVGDAIAIIGNTGEDIRSLLLEASTQRPPAPPVAEASADTGTPRVSQAGAPTIDRVRSSPLARRLAAERGIDISAVSGSGPGGRVTKRDIEGAGRKDVGSAGTPAAAPAIVSYTDKIVPNSPMRRTIARRLSESMFSSPHIYLTVPIKMDALLAARRELNAGRPRKISLNAFLVRLAAEALKKHPGVNASWNGDSILYRGSVDIGLAVALSDGLVTPVVRDCVAKGVLAIDAELSDLISRARSGKLVPEEYTGAGFTVSNLGMYGIEEFTAIINPPAAAILAVGAIQRAPVVEAADGEPAMSAAERVAVRSMMRVTLSADHRVIDGAVGAQFLSDLRGIMENPFRAFL